MRFVRSLRCSRAARLCPLGAAEVLLRLDGAPGADMGPHPSGVEDVRQLTPSCYWHSDWPCTKVREALFRHRLTLVPDTHQTSSAEMSIEFEEPAVPGTKPFSKPPIREARTVALRFMVSPGEKEHLVAVSKERGISMSELVRTSLPLTPIEMAMTTPDGTRTARPNPFLERAKREAAGK